MRYQIKNDNFLTQITQNKKQFIFKIFSKEINFSEIQPWQPFLLRFIYNIQSQILKIQSPRVVFLLLVNDKYDIRQADAKKYSSSLVSLLLREDHTIKTIHFKDPNIRIEFLNNPNEGNKTITMNISFGLVEKHIFIKIKE